MPAESEGGVTPLDDAAGRWAALQLLYARMSDCSQELLLKVAGTLVDIDAEDAAEEGNDATNTN